MLKFSLAGKTAVAGAVMGALLTGSCLFSSAWDDDTSRLLVSRSYASPEEEADWVIYWYLCGSDLETEYGSATNDLEELLSADLPDNVKIVIETGGAQSWNNDMVPNNKLTRYVYDKEGCREVESLPNASMGDASTLEDFLRFGQENFSARHQAFIFWDHGGGSLGGVAVDENYRGDALSLNEIHEAFSRVFTEDASSPAFDIVGFDACLMATIDNANNLYGFANYMVASEEYEPGTGWDYEAWPKALARNPQMDGWELGRIICDTYYNHCRDYGVEDEATLSLIDLSGMPELVSAYEAVGQEALDKSAANPQAFFSAFARGALQAENYGGNTRELGYVNMIDLGAFVRNNASLMPDSSSRFLSVLQDTVSYQVRGPYRSNGMGLSGYYSLDGEREGLDTFQSIDAASPVYKRLYARLLGTSYEGLTLPPLVFNIASLEDTPVNHGSDSFAVVKLPPEALDEISEVRFQLVYLDMDDEVIVWLGSDSDVECDWDYGIFRDNFGGNWPCLDGHLVFMEIVESGEKYNLYSIPILLNGMECNLQAVYDFDRQAYKVLGARRGVVNNISDRDLIRLKKGDRITTIHYGSTFRLEDDMIEVEGDTFTINGNPVLKDEPMGDGKFGYMFEFVNARNETADSEMVIFDVIGNDIYLLD